LTISIIIKLFFCIVIDMNFCCVLEKIRRTAC
jgi:hypothetical protein